MIGRARLCQTVRRYGTIKTLLATQPTSPTEVHGWIRSFRKGKKLSFLIINDGSTAESLQAVLPNELIRDDLSFGGSVRLEGTLVKSVKAQQAYELKTSSVTLLGAADAEHPLQKKYTSAEHLRSIAHFRPRTQFNAALLRVQSSLLHALSTFYHEQEYVHALPPILTSSDCEGAGEVFEITGSQAFFGSRTYLTVSTQLHLEALAMGVGKVWTLTPTFRAEQSTTARHLAEFRMIEAELCFTKNLDEVMDSVEGMVKHLTRHVQCDKDVDFIHTLDAENIEQVDMSARWMSTLTTWPRITYEDALTLLQRSSIHFQHSPVVGCSLSSEHERYIASHYNSPVFVTHYPASQKPFYMSRHEDKAECFDLLVPGLGELCGGSLRIHNHEDLKQQMMKEKVDLPWYLALRAQGTVPHGGYGVGWERLIGYLTGISNVREIAAFPRWYKHCVG